MKTAVPALLLATLNTKADEARYLADRVSALGFDCEILDVSITADGGVEDRPSGSEKLQEMARVSRWANGEIKDRLSRGTLVVIGLGGGTGTRIIADAYSGMHFAVPKVLISTMAFDPRRYTADNSIILIPSVCDLSGLGPSVRQILNNAAAVVAGLASHCENTANWQPVPSVGITALGVTEQCAESMRRLLGAKEVEVSVFHANGYGGRALRRWQQSGAIIGLIDMTIHEIVWLLFNENSPVPQDRFRAGRTIPRVIMPGGANFRTEGPINRLGKRDRERPYFRHSPDFTHVALTAEEMAEVGRFLAAELNMCDGPARVLLPMGGFSSEDSTNGAIENPEGRDALANALIDGLDKRYSIRKLDAHINDEATARAAVRSFTEML